MGDSAGTLTPRQLRFVEEYVLDRNGKQAAIRAGYSAASAEVQASRLLRHAQVKAEIDRRVAKVSTALDITHERIKREMARIGFSDVRKFYDENGRMLEPHELDDDAAAVISAIEQTEVGKGEGDGEVVLTRKFKTWNKVAALQDLAKITGLMKDGANVNIGLGLAIEIKL